MFVSVDTLTLFADDWEISAEAAGRHAAICHELHNHHPAKTQHRGRNALATQDHFYTQKKRTTLAIMLHLQHVGEFKSMGRKQNVPSLQLEWVYVSSSNMSLTNSALELHISGRVALVSLPICSLASKSPNTDSESYWHPSDSSKIKSLKSSWGKKREKEVQA